MIKSRLLLCAALLVFSSVVYTQKELPQTPKAFVYADFGPTTATNIAAKMNAFYRKLREEKSCQGYVINYGSAKAIKTRKKFLMKGINFRTYDSPRITFVDSLTRKPVRTIMWIVPDGAENPMP